MKRRLVFLFVLMACLLYAVPSMAALDSGFVISVGLGDRVTPEFPDLAYRIGNGLTADKFHVTIGPEEVLHYFAEDGSVMVDDVEVSEDECTRIPFTITYTPKRSGVGKKTEFNAAIHVYRKVEEIIVRRTIYPYSREMPETLVMAVGDQEKLTFSTARGTYTAGRYKVVNHNEDVVQCVHTLSYAGGQQLEIIPLKEGHAAVDIMAYNGFTRRFNVQVDPLPTRITFGVDSVLCCKGDNVDLGIEFDGALYAGPDISVYQGPDWQHPYALNMMTDDFFPQLQQNGNYNLFHASRSGSISVVVDAGRGVKSALQVVVYDRVDATGFNRDVEFLNVGDSWEFSLINANGSTVYLPMQLTAGKEMATLSLAERSRNRMLLQTTGAGQAEITVDNPNGPPLVKQIPVYEMPGKAMLNATELTLYPGDIFDFDVTFDAGKTAWELEATEYTVQDNRACISLSGKRLTANLPGEALITVKSRAGENAQCRVRVLGEVKDVFIALSDEPVKVNEAVLAVVMDADGNIYPATFTGWSGVKVTKDGWVTGELKGTAWLKATLEDGRSVQCEVEVEQWPTWIQHDDMLVRVGSGTVSFESINSSAGKLYCDDVEVEIQDESIAVLTENKRGLRLLALGTTHISMRAKNGGAQCTFILRVIGDDEYVYFAPTEVEVPEGYSSYLPETVSDGYGNVVPVTWEITYQGAGAGNPNATGFSLEGNVISCHWASAVCEVTGTAPNGGSVKISVRGYKLAEELYFIQPIYTIKTDPVYDSDYLFMEKQVTAPAGYKTGPLAFMIEDESIARIVDNSNSAYGISSYVEGLKPGETILYVISPVNGAVGACLVVVEENEPKYLIGDLNYDGHVDSDDLTNALNFLRNPQVDYIPARDFNKDGNVDVKDVLMLARYIKGWDVTLK